MADAANPIDVDSSDNEEAHIEAATFDRMWHLGQCYQVLQDLEMAIRAAPGALRDLRGASVCNALRRVLLEIEEGLPPPLHPRPGAERHEQQEHEFVPALQQRWDMLMAHLQALDPGVGQDFLHFAAVSCELARRGETYRPPA